MLLYLLRHAEAESEAESDDVRKLTAKGWDQARQVGRFLEAQDIDTPFILASPVLRAEQTATTVAGILATDRTIAPWLACGMTPPVALEQLEVFETLPAVMLVGHEPDLSSLIAYLLGAASSSRIHVRKASLTLLQLPLLRAGMGRLEFSIPCKLMP